MSTENDSQFKPSPEPADSTRRMVDRSWIRAFDEATWVNAFADAAQDDSLLAAFRRAFQHRRSFSWLPEHDASDRDALTGAILRAANIPRLAPESGLMPEASTEGLDTFRAIFNSAVELFVEIRTSDLLNRHLELCGFGDPKEFAQRALAAYAANSDAGTSSPDTW